MVNLFKFFSWATIVSGLGLVFTEGPEAISDIFDTEASKSKMENFRIAFEEMTIRDHKIVQRLNLKTQIFNAFKNREITIQEAASCFQHLVLYSDPSTEIILPEFENYSPNLRACLGLLLWLNDPAFVGNDLEIKINDFRSVVNTAKLGNYHLELPKPNAKLLSDFIY